MEQCKLLEKSHVSPRKTSSVVLSTISMNHGKWTVKETQEIQAIHIIGAIKKASNHNIHSRFLYCCFSSILMFYQPWSHISAWTSRQCMISILSWRDMIPPLPTRYLLLQGRSLLTTHFKLSIKEQASGIKEVFMKQQEKAAVHDIQYLFWRALMDTFRSLGIKRSLSNF